jgi:hypothetical protein
MTAFWRAWPTLTRVVQGALEPAHITVWTSRD